VERGHLISKELVLLVLLLLLLLLLPMMVEVEKECKAREVRALTEQMEGMSAWVAAYLLLPMGKAI
jgi:hypothetical protein